MYYICNALHRGGGDIKREKKSIEKIMVSARIPRYCKEYAEKKGLSITDLIMAGFDKFRETDVSHALKRLQYHEDSVLHWRHIVLHHEQECNTKASKCNTIKDNFIKNGRGSKENKVLDINWLKVKVEKMVEDGIIITVDELYKHCVKKE